MLLTVKEHWDEQRYSLYILRCCSFWQSKVSLLKSRTIIGGASFGIARAPILYPRVCKIKPFLFIFKIIFLFPNSFKKIAIFNLNININFNLCNIFIMNNAINTSFLISPLFVSMTGMRKGMRMQIISLLEGGGGTPRPGQIPSKAFSNPWHKCLFFFLNSKFYFQQIPLVLFFYSSCKWVVMFAPSPVVFVVQDAVTSSGTKKKFDRPKEISFLQPRTTTSAIEPKN